VTNSKRMQSKHSIVVFMGDVHCGWIASCPLAFGIDLMEVLSSLVALVDKEAEGQVCGSARQRAELYMLSPLDTARACHR
jgi:hypothetical protein